MRVVVEQMARKDAGEELIRPLFAALETQTFSEVCCIGALGGTSVYARCPDAQHGVVVNLASLDEDGIDRIIRMLAASVGPRA